VAQAETLMSGRTKYEEGTFGARMGPPLAAVVPLVLNERFIEVVVSVFRRSMEASYRETEVALPGDLVYFTDTRVGRDLVFLPPGIECPPCSPPALDAGSLQNAMTLDKARKMERKSRPHGAVDKRRSRMLYRCDKCDAYKEAVGFYSCCVKQSHPLCRQCFLQDRHEPQGDHFAEEIMTCGTLEVARVLLNLLAGRLRARKLELQMQAQTIGEAASSEPASAPSDRREEDGLLGRSAGAHAETTQPSSLEKDEDAEHESSDGAEEKLLCATMVEVLERTLEEARREQAKSGGETGKLATELFRRTESGCSEVLNRADAVTVTTRQLRCRAEILTLRGHARFAVGLNAKARADWAEASALQPDLAGPMEALRELLRIEHAHRRNRRELWRRTTKVWLLGQLLQLYVAISNMVSYVYRGLRRSLNRRGGKPALVPLSPAPANAANISANASSSSSTTSATPAVSQQKLATSAKSGSSARQQVSKTPAPQPAKSASTKPVVVPAKESAPARVPTPTPRAEERVRAMEEDKPASDDDEPKKADCGMDVERAEEEPEPEPEPQEESEEEVADEAEWEQARPRRSKGSASFVHGARSAHPPVTAATGEEAQPAAQSNAPPVPVVAPSRPASGSTSEIACQTTNVTDAGTQTVTSDKPSTDGLRANESEESAMATALLVKSSGQVLGAYRLSHSQLSDTSGSGRSRSSSPPGTGKENLASVVVSSTPSQPASGELLSLRMTREQLNESHEQLSEAREQLAQEHGEHKRLLERMEELKRENRSMKKRMVGLEHSLEKTRRELHNSEKAVVGVASLNFILASVREGVCITDANRLIVWCNKGFELLTGYTKHEILGRNCNFLQGAETSRETASKLGNAIRQERDVRAIILNYRKDGTPFWNDLSITPVVKNGAVAFYCGIQSDASHAQRLKFFLDEQAEAAGGGDGARAASVATSASPQERPAVVVGDDDGAMPDLTLPEASLKPLASAAPAKKPAAMARKASLTSLVTQEDSVSAASSSPPLSGNSSPKIEPTASRSEQPSPEPDEETLQAAMSTILKRREG